MSGALPGASPSTGPVAYTEWERVDACPICGSTGKTVVDSEASVVRCTGCGHRYVDPRPTQAEVTRGYSLPTSYDDWVSDAEARESMWRRRFDEVLGGDPPDVGGGIGTFLAIARERGWSVEGTEVSSTAAAKALQQHGITIRLGIVEEAAPAGPYEVICLWHVIEHLPNPGETLRFCRGLLADNGKIILAMPNDGEAKWAPTVISNLARRGLGRTPSRRYKVLRPGIESHIQHFNARSIRRLLGQSGFLVKRVAVDDASPSRSRLGGLVFRGRVLLTRLTPFNFGHEMLVIATLRGGSDADR